MMSVYQLKPKFQDLLRGLVRNLAVWGVTPNQVTISAILLSFATGLLLVFNHEGPVLLLIPVVLFVRMALNAIDGMLAREHNMKSDLGTFLNELGDVVSDVFLYLPFALVSGVSSVMVVVVVFLAMLTEVAGIVGVQIGASRRYDGPMGKSDRAFLFGALAIFLGFWGHLASSLEVFWWLFSLLLVVTVVHRTQEALKEVRR